MKSNSELPAALRLRIPSAPRITWTTCLLLGLLTLIGISRPAIGQQHPATTSATIITSTGVAVGPTAGPASTTPSGQPAHQQPSCSNVKSALEQRGVVVGPTDEQAGSSIFNGMLRFCEIPAKGACCQNSMELKLATLSRTQLERNTKESISKLSSVLGTRANKFNDYFKQLLAQSKKEFHEMFMRTYGVIYEQNSYVFSDLFSELENYYTRGKVDLADAMDNFFNVLYQKMFTVLNAQYKFDDKYLVCVSEHMKELKPFGDVPDKLSVQIKRSFVATRTYEQALSTAAEVARNLISLRPSAECTAALTKMQQCGLCRGYTQKPCSNYCVNVMKGCLHYYDELDDEWDNFVASMEKVSERLLGPFNIVMVVEPINIKISEAIMNFQDTGEEITKQVFLGCGKPQLGRRRRSISPKFVDASDDDLDNFRFAEDDGFEADVSLRVARSADPGNRELQYEPMQFSHDDSGEKINNGQNSRGTSGRRKTSSKQKNRQMNMKKDESRDENKEPMIDKLVKDIRQKVKDSKKFWTNLPFQICNQEDYSASIVGAEGNCWNGNSVDKYPHAIVQGIASNPEFPQKATVARQSALVANQLYLLKNAVGHLRNAYNGLDVEWNDNEDSYDGSGSGAGSGDDDDDDPNGGSGLGPIDYPERTSDNIDTTSTGHSDSTSSTTSHGSTSGVPNSTTSTTNNKHPKPDEYDERENEVNPHDRKKGTPSSGSRIKMSLRQAMLTYMLPIYMAWFGGVLCDLF